MRSLRLGFVGVGQWARELVRAFTELGHVCVAHEREDPGGMPPPEGFGTYISGGIDHFEDIDLIVAAAPPDPTTLVAMRCAEWGKPCIATKPLLRHPSLTQALFEVDFWRLDSGPYKALQKAVKHHAAVGRHPKELTIRMCGNGPFRSFDGVLDWGPHALAFLYDLLPSQVLTDVVVENRKIEGHQGRCIRVMGHCGRTLVNLLIGNGMEPVDNGSGATHKTVAVSYDHDQPLVLHEADGIIRYTDRQGGVLSCRKETAIKAFLTRVIKSLESGETNDRTLRYSRRATDDLTEWLAAADRSA